MEINTNGKMTTIKLSRLTKGRLDRLKGHKRETYEDILQNIMNLLNICRINPEKARAKLLALDRIQRKQPSFPVKGNKPIKENLSSRVNSHV